jgi:hypothetical protein
VHLRVELRTRRVSTAGRHLRKQVLVGETYPWFQSGTSNHFFDRNGIGDGNP